MRTSVASVGFRDLEDFFHIIESVADYLSFRREQGIEDTEFLITISMHKKRFVRVECSPSPLQGEKAWDLLSELPEGADRHTWRATVRKALTCFLRFSGWKTDKWGDANKDELYIDVEPRQ